MNHLNGSYKWAILLCKFSDRTQGPTASHFVDLLVKRNTGGLNDYWRSVSYGKINLDGSKVYGWRTLPYSLKEFGKFSRSDKIYKAALHFSNDSDPRKRVDFRKFYGIMVIADRDIDDGGSVNIQSYELNDETKSYGTVLVNSGNYNPTFIAHEMGHGFGFHHSYDDSLRRHESLWVSNPGEYYDTWDIMSASDVHGFTHPQFGFSGPIMNVPYADSAGWIDGSDFLRKGDRHTVQTVKLAPLNHPEIRGRLAASIDYRDHHTGQVGRYTVEFRVQDGWDKGIPTDGVILIHRVENDTSYLIGSDLSSSDSEWTPGKIFVDERNDINIEIVRVDTSSRTCTVRLGSNHKSGNLWGQKFRAINNYAASHGYISGFPNFYEDVLYDGAFIKREAAEWRDIPASELGNPQTLEGRFRAVSHYASEHGFRGAFPNFFEANYGPVYGTVLIHRGAADWRDIPASELGNPKTLKERFHAVARYASAHGYIGAFPNFFEANYGHGKVYGTVLVKREAADWRDVSAAELGNPQTPEERFRAVAHYASKQGYIGAFPNFFEADYGHGKVYGTILIKREAADWRDVRAAELGDPQTPEERFRAVAHYASKQGYIGAFPNFFEANRGVVYGTILLKSDYADWKDVMAPTLDNAITPEERLQATARYGTTAGFFAYNTGFPTFFEANYGKGKVYGTTLIKRNGSDLLSVSGRDLDTFKTPESRFRAFAKYATRKGYVGAFPYFHADEHAYGKVLGSILIKSDAADWRDIRAAELGNPRNPEARFRAISHYAIRHGYVGGFPNFHEANYGEGKVYGAILIKPDAADWYDIRAHDLGFRFWRGS